MYKFIYFLFKGVLSPLKRINAKRAETIQEFFQLPNETQQEKLLSPLKIKDKNNFKANFGKS